MALDKLLSFPEKQQLEEAEAGLLLWDEDEEQTKGERRGEMHTLMGTRRKSKADRMVDTNAGVGERSGSNLHKELTPPTLNLPLNYSSSQLR